VAISTPASIATPITPGTTNATMALTTNASVASGGKVWVFVSWFHSTVTLNGVSDGGSTVFTIDHQSKNGSTGVAIISADYPAGFASGGTLTATFSASGAADQQMAAFYSTGVLSGSGAGYGAIGGSNNASTTWDAGATTVLNGDILIGLSKFEDSVTTTSTPTGGNTELADWNNAGGFASTVTYQIGTGASIHAQGTWSNTSAASLGTRSCSVAYTAAVTSMPAKVFQPIPFLPIS